MPIPELPFTVEEWSNLQPRLLWAYEGAVTPECRDQFSERHHLSAWWMQAGSVTLRRGARTWRAQAGEWLFSGVEPMHQAFSADARIVSVNFKLEWPSGDSLVDPTLVLPARDLSPLCRAGRKLAHFVSARFPKVRWDLWAHRMDLMVFLELQKLFSAWTVAYVGAMLASGAVPMRMSGVDPRILTALRKLDTHPWGTPFREEDLAGELGLSAGHLDRLFLRGLGLTPRAHLQKRRLETAMALLADDAVPIKQIAYNLGFGSSSHFCHWFQHATGKSPRAHRSARG